MPGVPDPHVGQSMMGGIVGEYYEMQWLVAHRQEAMARAVAAHEAAGGLPIDSTAALARGRVAAEEVRVQDNESALTAERLLQRVLPEELYLRLNALGWFEYYTPLHLITVGRVCRFVLSRRKKTLLHNTSGESWSCCIEPAGGVQVPDQDRLVAEYLLLVNDPEKYLRTANLTQVGWPMGVEVRTDVERGVVRARESFRDLNSWETTAPPRHRAMVEAQPAPPPLTSLSQLIAWECLRLLSATGLTIVTVQRLSPDQIEAAERHGCTRQVFTARPSELPDEMVREMINRGAWLGHAMGQLRQRLEHEPRRIVAYLDLPLPPTGSPNDILTTRAYDQYGRSLLVRMAMNPAGRIWETRVDVEVLLAPENSGEIRG